MGEGFDVWKLAMIVAVVFSLIPACIMINSTYNYKPEPIIEAHSEVQKVDSVIVIERDTL
jgi:hypothetical protein